MNEEQWSEFRKATRRSDHAEATNAQIETDPAHCRKVAKIWENNICRGVVDEYFNRHWNARAAVWLARAEELETEIRRVAEEERTGSP